MVVFLAVVSVVVVGAGAALALGARRVVLLAVVSVLLMVVVGAARARRAVVLLAVGLSFAAVTVANELVFADFRLLSLACATLGASRLTVRHWRKKFFLI